MIASSASMVVSAGAFNSVSFGPFPDGTVINKITVSTVLLGSVNLISIGFLNSRLFTTGSAAFLAGLDAVASAVAFGSSSLFQQDFGVNQTVGTGKKYLGVGVSSTPGGTFSITVDFCLPGVGSAVSKAPAAGSVIPTSAIHGPFLSGVPGGAGVQAASVLPGAGVSALSALGAVASGSQSSLGVPGGAGVGASGIVPPTSVNVPGGPPGTPVVPPAVPPGLPPQKPPGLPHSPGFYGWHPGPG